MLMASAADPNENVKFIDTLLRLGLSYQFENDIENQLESIFNSHQNYLNDLDLSSTSIVFRVFRQYGFKMSCNVFEKFKDADGKLKGTLIDDVRGMQTIEQMPPRLAARTYISFYEEEDSRDETLLKFAKLDFNRVQVLHKQEINQITRFWDKNNFSSELSYARERYVEAYTWINALFDETRYTKWRIIVSKILQPISLLDDTFDAYGTPQEIQRLIDTLKRWDTGALDDLQDYTKVICKAVLAVFDEIAEEASKDGRSYGVPYAKDSLRLIINSSHFPHHSCFKRIVDILIQANRELSSARLTRAHEKSLLLDSLIQLANYYHAEVKWNYDGYVPTFEEDMSVAMKTSTFDVLMTIAFIGMGEMAGIEAFEWLRKEPKIMSAVNFIGRLMDDIVSHKFEQLREHAPSGIECYMKQHSLSEEETLGDFKKLLEDAWKDVNEERMRPTAVPRNLLIRHLNFARVSYLFYKHGDGFTNPEYVEDDIPAMFLDPISI
ncbi:putative Terpene synthase 21 [Hibiscus syriacus]|uniref:Terpene synthase 21 n=1 Tax=Hibiscus syriacus TaxID=106335 RepID=A0A6A2WZN0_HIBSY|nr:putative Terpene synthase 21 [Hibiscus syriacus]